MTASGGPKPAFYVVMMLLILGVLGYGVYRFRDRIPGAGGTATISQDELAQMKGGVEAPDDASLTTYKEYDKLK